MQLSLGTMSRADEQKKNRHVFGAISAQMRSWLAVQRLKRGKCAQGFRCSASERKKRLTVDRVLVAVIMARRVFSFFFRLNSPEPRTCFFQQYDLFGLEKRWGVFYISIKIPVCQFPAVLFCYLSKCSRFKEVEYLGKSLPPLCGCFALKLAFVDRWFRKTSDRIQRPLYLTHNSVVFDLISLTVQSFKFE